MKFHCTYCGYKIETSNEQPGQLMACPSCSANILVPPPSISELSAKSKANPKKSDSLPTQGFVYRRLFLISLIGCLIFGALTAIYSLITSSFDTSQATILLTTVSLGTYSMTGLCCSALIGHPQHNRFGQIGIAVSVFSGFWAFVNNLAILANQEINNWGELLQVRFSFLVVAVAFAHCSLLLRIHTTNQTVQNVRYVTLGIIAMFSMVLLGNIMAPDNFSTSWKLISILSVLNVLGTIATPLYHAATNFESVRLNIASVSKC